MKTKLTFVTIILLVASGIFLLICLLSNKHFLPINKKRHVYLNTEAQLFYFFDSDYKSKNLRLSLSTCKERLGLKTLNMTQKHIYYSKHKAVDNSNIMYIVYSDNRIDAFIEYSWYTERWYDFKDFDGIIPTKNTLKDVVELDRTSDFKLKYGKDKTTYHLCKQGLVKITYTQKNGEYFVASVEKQLNDIVNQLYNDDQKN